MSDFWNTTFVGLTSEADVEHRLVVPLLLALGYELDDIASKYPVEFREGRPGRRPEADYVCFNGPLRTRDASLVVVEAKRPGEALPDGRLQGESYAANLRAPLLLLTNGERMEIWQLKPTQESERVLDVSISDLAANRGIIEILLSKIAVVNYCRTFHVKTVLEASADFGRYETAELRRSLPYAASIDRTVRGAATTVELTTERLLAECPTGCIIGGPSGFGKTTLSKRLFRQAIEARWQDGSSRLPIDVPAPDLEQTGISLLNFMQARVAAHVPGFTRAALEDRIRSSGVVVVIDGFDRASPSFRSRLTADLTNLLRDYPLVQVFVFSREAVRPDIALPLFSLAALTEAEMRALETLVLAESGDSFVSIIGMMPPILLALCDNPLLLQLTLEYWKREKQFPATLLPLFRSWLENLLKAKGSNVVSSIHRESALTLIAEATFHGPTSGEHILKLFEQAGIPSDVLNELVACDAARTSGSLIEVHHEALADYLRASKMAIASEAEMLARIPGLALSAGSFFPVLLISLLPNRRLQSALWKRLTEAGPRVYFDALRYRFDVSSELSKLDPRQLAEEYLGDLLEGIEQPLDNFFPALRPRLVEAITSEPGDRLGVVGDLHRPSNGLAYKLYARSPQDEASVQIQKPTLPGILRGVSLDLSNYRLDSARLVGINLLKEGVLEVVASEFFQGGHALAQERLMGRCRFLAQEYDFPVRLDMDLDVLENALLPYQNERVMPRPFSHDESFSVREMLSDLEILRSLGVSSLDPWWNRLGWNAQGEMLSDDAIARVLDELYRRTQMVYYEVVKTSFPKIAQEMAFFPVLPIKWALTVVRGSPRGTGTSVYYAWSPVAKWEQAGADVSFCETPPREELEELRRNVEQTRAELASFGRPNSKLPRFNGFTQLPDFSGQQYNGRFDGGTPAIHEACSWLRSDLNDIFSSMPHRD
ncbi:type I restriction enzyme HsdR N-terminal domain-containing protein [Bradyrhizobium ganzhouense]|uniref:NACHT domain-containing protein n=1 Tax=Bradyrhizobium ganzhouense TaxID=1179767 RepID=UPI003CF3D44B